MQFKNPYAIYVHCDGAMDYGAKGMGGVGFIIQFPESVGIEDISVSIGRYKGANIEVMELEALTQAMLETNKVFQRFSYELRNVSQIIFVTDRFGLADTEKRTNEFLIKQWRSNKWKNFEEKPIKNHEVIDKLDKTRTKLRNSTRCRVQIQYMPRKKNRVADKLAKKGKAEGLVISKLEKTAEKIGRRRFDGAEIPYKVFKEGDEIHIHVFKKEGVQDQWEVWGELCSGVHQGKKLKMYVEDDQAEQLQRGNEFRVKLSHVFRYYFQIENQIEKIDKLKDAEP